MNHKLALQFGFFLGGAILGAAAAGWMAREYVLRNGQAELKSYADRVTGSGEQFGNEADEAIRAVTGDGLPICSNDELALMRRLVYNSRHIKDLGRLIDEKLYCTTGLGKVSAPYTLPAPDIDIQGRKIYASIRLAISPNSFGLVLIDRGVSVVINPEIFKSYIEPPMTFSSYAYDAGRRLLVVEFGDPVPLSSDQVISEEPILRNGLFFQSSCSRKRPFCIVASVSRADVLAKGQQQVSAARIAGALTGAALALILILLYDRQRSMERQLRRAVRRGELTLVYQPIVDLETLKVVGAEALSRWTNDSGEQVSPDVFIPIAEAKGFASDITRLAIKTTLHELGDLVADGRFAITINVTAQELTEPGFYTHLDRCMAAARVKPSAIGLELTERSTANHDLAIDSIARLKLTGHKVYIDDFGTGYSSLAYLHQLAADSIKIDRIFTQTVGTEAVTASVVPQLLDIARQLDLQVVVEGIETVEQAQYFRAAGPGILGQGWLFSKAVPAAQFRQIVARGSFSLPGEAPKPAQPIEQHDPQSVAQLR